MAVGSFVAGVDEAGRAAVFGVQAQVALRCEADALLQQGQVSLQGGGEGVTGSVRESAGWDGDEEFVCVAVAAPFARAEEDGGMAEEWGEARLPEPVADPVEPSRGDEGFQAAFARVVRFSVRCVEVEEVLRCADGFAAGVQAEPWGRAGCEGGAAPVMPPPPPAKRWMWPPGRSFFGTTKAKSQP